MVLLEPFEWLQLLLERPLLQKTVDRFISALGALLKRCREYWHENGDFSIGSSLPVTSNILLRSCLGAAANRRGTSLY